MIVDPIIADSSAYVFNCTTVLKLNDGSLLNLFHVVEAWPSLYVVWLTMVLFAVYLVFWLQIAIQSFALFHQFLIKCFFFTVIFHGWGRGPLCGQNIYSRLSVSRIPRDSLKYFEISVQAHLTNICIMDLLKLEIYLKYCGKEEKSISTIFFTCC